MCDLAAFLCVSFVPRGCRANILCVSYMSCVFLYIPSVHVLCLSCVCVLHVLCYLCILSGSVQCVSFVCLVCVCPVCHVWFVCLM